MQSMFVEIWCEVDPMKGYECARCCNLSAIPAPGETITNLFFKGMSEWIVQECSWDFDPDNPKYFESDTPQGVSVGIYCKPEE